MSILKRISYREKYIYNKIKNNNDTRQDNKENNIESYKEIFKSKNWENKKPSERLDALQKLENEYALKQGREPCKVMLMPDDYNVETKSYTAGKYDSSNNIIYINGRLLENKNENCLAVETVLHEGRHAYQEYVIENPDMYDNMEEIENFRHNSGHGYISVKEDRLMYLTQPTERDARDFAANETDMLFQQLNDTGSSNYGHYRSHRDKVERAIRYEAMNIFGDDYEKQVDDIVKKRFYDGLSEKKSSLDDLNNIESALDNQSAKEQLNVTDKSNMRNLNSGPNKLIDKSLEEFYVDKNEIYNQKEEKIKNLNELKSEQLDLMEKNQNVVGQNIDVEHYKDRNRDRLTFDRVSHTNNNELISESLGAFNKADKLYDKNHHNYNKEYQDTNLSEAEDKSSDIHQLTERSLETFSLAKNNINDGKNNSIKNTDDSNSENNIEKTALNDGNKYIEKKLDNTEDINKNNDKNKVENANDNTSKGNNIDTADNEDNKKYQDDKIDPKDGKENLKKIVNDEQKEDGDKKNINDAKNEEKSALNNGNNDKLKSNITEESTDNDTNLNNESNNNDYKNSKLNEGEKKYSAQENKASGNKDISKNQDNNGKNSNQYKDEDEDEDCFYDY